MLSSQSEFPSRTYNVHFYNPINNKLSKGGIKLFMHNNESYIFNTLFVEFFDLFVEEA